MVENFDIQNRYASKPLNGTFGMNVAGNGSSVTPMQAQIDVSKIQEAGSDTYLGQRLTSFSDIDPLIQYGVTIPTWIAVNQAMEQYSRLCRGDYNSSVIHKFGALGDKISNFLFGNSVGQAVNKTANGTKNAFKKYIYDNSALLRAFDKTPSVPEIGLVRTQVGGIKSMLSHDAITVLDGFLEPLKSYKDFDSLGASKAEIDQIKAAVAKGVNEEERALLLQAEEYKFLNKGAKPGQVQAFKNMEAAKRLEKLKELKIKSIGFADLAEYNEIKKAPEKHIPRILEILEKTDKKFFARMSYSNKNFATIIKGELAGRKVYFSELYNKLYSASGGNHRTVLGRTFAKLSNQILEGATSRISGGKIAALMQAYFLAEVLIRANRQETNGDKFKSFMERFAELIGFFVFMPPSIQLMHKIGGLQYSGMTPQQIEEYRAALKEFNEHVMNCDWTKDVYKQKRKELRAKFRPHTKNPFVYAARKVGDIITVGLEQVRPYTKHKVEKVDLTINKVMESPVKYFKSIPKRLADVMRNPKYWLKQMAGYPVRFLLPMVVFVSFFNKCLVKGVNAIFGKPKEALADESKHEEMQEAARQQASQQQVTAEQQRQILAAAAAAQAAQQNKQVVSVQQAPQTSKASNEPHAQISHTGNPNNVQTETSQKSTQPDIPDEKRYIPSTEGVKIKDANKNDDTLEKALARVERMEKEAYKTLGKL